MTARDNYPAELHRYADIDVMQMPDDQYDRMLAEIDALRSEVIRLETMVDTELTYQDLEQKIRGGVIDMTVVWGPEARPAMKMFAALCYHFLLGDEGTMPPNYQTAEISVKPAGAVRPMRVQIEVIKPGGKSSHDIRRDLEAQLAALT